MVIHVKSSSVDKIAPEEFLDWVEKNVDPRDEESVLEASERLCALYNNRDFVIDRMAEHMLSLSANKHEMMISAQNSIHGIRETLHGVFFIRSVIWTPPLTQAARARELQDKVLSFGLPHDHNFSLLTIGYDGPG